MHSTGQTIPLSCESAPLQRPELEEKAEAPVVISPKPETPPEAEIEAFEENSFGQLKFF